MKNYGIKTIYPADETVDGNKQTTTKQIDEIASAEADDVIKLYNSYKNSGYDVNVKFTPPANDDEGEEVSPFDVAKKLTKQGIDYKATLKIKTKGNYDYMIDIIHLIESEGFDLTVNCQLKVNDSTTLNVDDPTSWTDEDAVFKVTPKATTNNIFELKSLYDALDSQGCEVEITITPKAAKAENIDDDNDSFASQLAAYPENTLVTFKLSQSDY